jgi:[ribosomal protein S5]-alanine N-acetyltransferase
MTPFADLLITTPRLTLRPLTEGDADDLFTIFSDSRVMRYWSTPAWTDPAQALRMIASDRESLASREDLRLGLVRRDLDRVVGTASLFKIDAGNRRAEIGYALAFDQQGAGLMSEALDALVDLAFDHSPGSPFDDLLLHRLEADIDPRNAASAASLTRLGFQLEGTLRERWQVGGEISDSGLYGLLRTDWQRRVSPRA